jgi:hypothetical protein|tara:strand:- start:3453 stop:3683 length:231 start_codon:yes stop_codon:yes gene_type:complete
MSMKIYINCKSKAQLNRDLANGAEPMGYNYSMFGGGGWYNLHDCPAGTVIALYTRKIDGNPYATSWGTWNPTKNQV